LVRGQLRSFVSSPAVTRQFCDHCGTPVTYSNTADPTTVDVTIATLDRPDAMEPVDHVWMEDAACWDRPADGRPQHPQGRPK
jgi:hypothetical protein